MRLATSRFLGRPNNFVVNGYAAKSVNEGVSGRDWSYGFSAHYPNDRFNAQVAYREIQENFKPALGFVQRGNVRLFRVAGSYNPRPKNFLNVQQMFHDVYYTRFTRLDNGEVESWDLYVTLLDWHLKSGDNLHGMFDFNPTYERLFEPFEISPGVFLLPGEYRFTRFRSNLLSTATKRRLSGSVNLTYGGYWSGKAEQVTTSLTYKVPPRFTVTVSTNQTFARLPEGHFIARIFTGNVELRGDAAAVAVESDAVPTTDPGTWAGRAASDGRCSRATICSSRSTRAGSRKKMAAACASGRRTARSRRSSSIRFDSERTGGAARRVRRRWRWVSRQLDYCAAIADRFPRRTNF